MTRFGQQKGSKEKTVFLEQNNWNYCEKFRDINIIKDEVSLDDTITNNIVIRYTVLCI